MAITTVIVTEFDLANTPTEGLTEWFMYNDDTNMIDNTLGSFVQGPGTPPHVPGSVQFTLGTSLAMLDRKNIATYQFTGTSIASITVMGFTAYSHSGIAGPNESPFLNFNVDFTGTNTFQGRLVYVPSANFATVPQDTWNTFDTINEGNALWTWSHYISNGNKWPDGDPNQYRTWSAILAAFPTATLLSSNGWLGVRVGEPGPTGYTGNVNSVTFGTVAGTILSAFEPAVTAQPFTADAGQPFTGTVATGFATAGFAAPFTAIINWGDGSGTSLGTVTVTGSTFTVTGAHTYASTSSGTFMTTVTVIDSNGNVASDSSTATVIAQDFTISASPVNKTIASGASDTFMINTMIVGAPGNITLSASAPTGLTASFAPNPVAAGSSSTLTIAVGATVAAGTYTVTVTGTEGASTHSTMVAVTVPAEDFTISASPTTLSIVQGGGGTSMINTTAIGTPGTIALSTATLPTGITATLSPTSIPAGNSSTLTVSVDASVTPGSYAVTVIGIEGSMIHSATVTVTVPAEDFTISASPTSLTIPQGGSNTSTISTTQVGSPGNVTLSTTGLPAGMTASFAPNPIAAGNSSTLIIAVGATVTPGTYPITVIGTEGTSTHSATVTITVPAEDFTISASPTSLTIPQGGSNTSTISTTQVGSPGNVTLSVSTPAGITTSFSANPIAAGNSSTLIIAVGATVTPGTYPITVIGTEGTSTHSATVTITVPPPAIVVTVLNIAPIEGNAFSGQVASGTFTGTSGPFSATINWGDSGSSAGTVTVTGSTFTVSGSHTYTDEGTFTLTVTVSDTSGHSGTNSSSITVADAVLTLVSMTVTGFAAHLALLSANFTDANPLSTVADFTATIAWGDSTMTIPTVVNVISSYQITSVTHIYASAGTYTVTLTIQDEGGSQVVGTRTVTVS